MTKVIDNFSNYTISQNGIVINTKTGQTKTAWLCQNGYLYLDLFNDGYCKKVPLHRILAIAFLPNPEKKRTVNHIDGNKLNNSLTNLEWATDSENMQHAYNTGLNKGTMRKISSEQAKILFSERIMMGMTITALAKELNVGLTQLSYRIKEVAKDLNLISEYQEELHRQKLQRQGK